MNRDAYTPDSMDAVRAGAEPGDSRFDGLHAEASAAVGYSANTLRGVRQRYRQSYTEALRNVQALRDELETTERRPNVARMPIMDGSSDLAASAAETGAEDARLTALRAEVERLSSDLGSRQTDLARLDLAARTLERTWLFLEQGDRSLVLDDVAEMATSNAGDVAMRIVEAQESERSRLAQEVHDGPAQSLSNAIFQVEHIERILDSDHDAARTELQFLRELLRRELGGVRSFVSQLRPPLLDELGLDGSILDTVEHMTTLTGVPIATDLRASTERLGDSEQTVVLRIVQEALQNVRKHAAAEHVTVATDIGDDGWVVEIRDDGRGFDVGAVAARGRRNFGLRFMRERAELIGARFDVRSRPGGGTVVRLGIPERAATEAQETT
jgi:signal transduction histidine kinase